MKEFYTVAEVAERWDCSDGQVRKMVQSGKLGSVQIGRRMIRVRAADVHEFESVAVLPQKEPCDVYVIRCGDYVKIGKAANPEKRIASLQAANPYDLAVVAILKADDGHQLERDLHKRFDHQRHRGEWFRIEGEVLQWVRKLAAEAA